MDSLCKSARDSYSPLDALLFDMDDTLYSSKVGIGQALKNNIDDFLVEKIGFARSEASALRIELFKKYGSSLAGLRALGYDIDADEYHSFVHGRLPYNLIKPDCELKDLLCSINQRKIIFTNSDRVHALKVLDRLGIKDCFEQIICFETMNPNLSLSSRPDEIPVVLKPAMEAMRIALDSAHVDPKRTLFLDDNVQNIAAGNAVGLRTALVGTTSKSKECDYALENIHDLIRVIPEIWFEKENDDQKVCCTRSQMGSFLAPTTVGA